MKNFLYITDNNELIETKAKEFAGANNLYFFYFTLNKESLDEIKYLYDTYNNIVIFLEGINKSSITNILLKTIEENTKNIYMYATTNTYDVNEPLKARFKVLYYDNKDIEKEVLAFIKTKKAKKELYSSLSFYIALANNTDGMNNLLLINEIIKQAKRCTFNTPWDYYFDVLKENYR